MSELDASTEFVLRQDVLRSFDAYRAKLWAEHKAIQERLESQRELEGFLSAAEGQHFIISAFANSRGFKHESGQWTFVPVGSLTEEPKAFEPTEMVIGKVGEIFPVHGSAVELYVPGVDNTKFMVSLSNIVSIEPVSQAVSVGE